MILTVTLIGLALFVACGFIIKARLRWSAGLYMIYAGVEAAASIAQWIIVQSGWHTTRIVMDYPGDFPSLGLLPFTAALVIVLYSSAWAGRTLLQVSRGHLVTWWRTVPAVVILAPTIAAALAVTWVESNDPRRMVRKCRGVSTTGSHVSRSRSAQSHPFCTLNPNPLYP
jgi:hypothetical protein